MGDADLLDAIVGHWAAIENGTHRVRDVTFREDACRVRQHKAARNMVTLRDLPIGLYNLLLHKKKTASSSLPSWQRSTSVDSVAKITLKNADIINLALGRPLSTKIAKNEVLAIAGTFESPSMNPKAKLVVVDPAIAGPGQILAVVATLTQMDYELAFLNSSSKGQGVAEGNFLATTAGTPSENGFDLSPFCIGGVAGGPHVSGFDLMKLSPVGSATLHGRFTFRFTKEGVTTNFDGLVTKGTIRASGKPISMFTE
jgi:hypothetical protein